MGRKYFIMNMLLVLLVLLFIGGIGYIIDPSQQVRYNSRYVGGGERLVNLGLARNYDYGSIIIGSSTSQNILKKDLDKLFDTNSINLALSGSTAYEHRRILNEVIKSKNCNLVIYGIDFFTYNWKIDEERVKIEDYSKNILKYLYNINTLKEEANIILKLLLNKKQKNWILKWSYWGADFKFSEEQLLSFDKSTQWGAQNIGILEVAKKGYDIEKMKANFNEFLKIVEENKNIEYKIYFPPYSSLYWYMIKETKNLEIILEFKKYVLNRVKEFSNIELYDFQLESEIVNNLNNYKDAVHFSPIINLEIITRIKNNENRVSEYSNLKIDTENIIKQDGGKYKLIEYINEN